MLVVVHFSSSEQFASDDDRTEQDSVRNKFDEF